ncbi:hypothetical protein PTTG_09786 [Puccinia triticina 1-1 BBBD Race 1]|uniref:Uncharacterized protein n=1 Tax=Puccinia triticina (isolate 1-1 / race 1 (BBBD)) TaxID=630390 RepID=A0A180G4D7_PUCT1|nr:hypothetical protein PTTG_09786 [Puccinia triticina 1-1 BBBD Race 1]
MANTAITNALQEGVLYSLTGARMIALNDGSTPTITYTQDLIMRIGKALDLALDFTNRTGVVGLGVIVEKAEIPSPHAGEDNQLEVIVSHNDWDPVARMHRPFLAKYIVPASKNLVKTHVLYVLGREMEIVGHLVDWDITAKMPIILQRLVPHLRPHLAETENWNSLNSTPTRKGKEREVEIEDEISWAEEPEDDKDNDDAEVASSQKRKSPGRPRRQILSGASKRLKRL